MKTAMGIALAALLSAIAVQAQDWSPGEREIWRLEDEYQARLAATDLEGLGEFWRDDFRADLYAASPHFQLTAAVAEYAEILRESYWAQEGDLGAVLALAQRAGAGLVEDQDVAEFIWLVSKANQLADAG